MSSQSVNNELLTRKLISNKSNNNILSILTSRVHFHRIFPARVHSLFSSKVNDLFYSSRIIQLRQYFVQGLNARNPRWCKSSRSRGQRSRLQREVTCANICKIINNSAADCSVSFKFHTDFDHVMLGAPRTFKVKGKKVKVTTWQNMPA